VAVLTVSEWQNVRSEFSDATQIACRVRRQAFSTRRQDRCHQQETAPGEASYGMRLNANIGSPTGAPWPTVRTSGTWALTEQPSMPPTSSLSG
jgi:hypothetical protein